MPHKGADIVEIYDSEKENLRRIRRNTLGDLLRRDARRDPAKTAMIFRDQKISYREWNVMVNQVAEGLSSRGVRSEMHVGIVGKNSLNFLTYALAVAKLGAVLVPVNPVLTAKEMAYILHHADIAAVAADSSLINRVEEGIREASLRPLVQVALDIDSTQDLWIPWDRVGKGHGEEWWGPAVDDDAAQILYTSGTESNPKGVLLTHRSLLDQFFSIIVAGEFRTNDVVLHALPLFHSAQLNAFFGPFLELGATHVLLEGPEPERIMEAIEHHQVTVFFAPPTVWIAILRSPSFSPSRFSSLKKAVYGASAMPVEILRELGRFLPQTRFSNMYGMTEMGPFATALPPEEQLTRPGSVGKPGVNVEMTVLRDDGSEASFNEPGEVCFRSSHALLGYYKDPEKTREAFRHGWYHTGDIGVIDAEGYLSIVDRKKDMIKTGGENVASREVEEVLYTHSAVQECAVIGVPHPYWGEAVIAVVVKRQGMDVSEPELIAHVRETLTGFKTPKRVVFQNTLPKNASGKIVKRLIAPEISWQDD